MYELGDFEGTWTVKAGLRLGRTLALAKVGSQYELREGSSVLCRGLGLDNVAFTLKNENACLSLKQGCDHLFGIEDNGISYDVWAAVRVHKGSEVQTGLSPTLPYWRLDKNWTVMAVTGGPPVHPPDIIRIKETTPTSEYGLYKVDPENDELIDTLTDNPQNRTLDGETTDRSVANWDRVAELKNFLFAMVIPPDEIVTEIRQDPANTEKPREKLKELGFLPFEVDMVVSNEGPAVWGAEEGG